MPLRYNGQGYRVPRGFARNAGWLDLWYGDASNPRRAQLCISNAVPCV